MEIRFMREEEQAQVTAMAETHPNIQEFPRLWERWGNWDRHPPIVTVSREGMLMGFHAVTFNRRNPYANSYYQLVRPEFRGQRIGGQMVEYLLEVANNSGNTRLKMLAPAHSDGYHFWTGFGLVPLFLHKGEYRFDLSIEGITTCEQLIEQAAIGDIFDVSGIPPAQWKVYCKQHPDLVEM